MSSHEAWKSEHESHMKCRAELSATKEKLADWQAAMVSESEVSMSLRKIISEQDVRIALYSKESVELAELKRENAELRKRLEALQARIDSLMLEYCPDDMTEEQIAVWGEHQQVTTLDFALKQ